MEPHRVSTPPFRPRHSPTVDEWEVIDLTEEPTPPASPEVNREAFSPVTDPDDLFIEEGWENIDWETSSARFEEEFDETFGLVEYSPGETPPRSPSPLEPGVYEEKVLMCTLVEKKTVVSEEYAQEVEETISRYHSGVYTTFTPHTQDLSHQWIPQLEPTGATLSPLEVAEERDELVVESEHRIRDRTPRSPAQETTPQPWEVLEYAQQMPRFQEWSKEWAEKAQFLRPKNAEPTKWCRVRIFDRQGKRHNIQIPPRPYPISSADATPLPTD